MKIAIIDLGTNTFNLLIVEKQSSGFTVIFNTKEAVMLGKEGIIDGEISTPALDRAYAAIKKFHISIQKHQCARIKALGTSAIRSAKNASELIIRVRNDFNIHIEPITGDQEATYIYYGAKAATIFDRENYLILDIGGGSNEFIIANKHQLIWKHSFNLGSARMLEKFRPHDPVLAVEIKTMQSFFAGELQLLTEQLKINPVSKLIGCSGAFDCFASMIHQQKFKKNMAKNQKSYDFSTAEFEDLANKLIKTNREERLNFPGLDPIRVDTIVMATIFTQLVLKLTNIEKITQSAYSLKEGLASKI